PRPHLALHRQGAALRFRLPHPRAPARTRHGLRAATRADDAYLPGRIARGLAQRERRRILEEASGRIPPEGNLLHRAARLDGHRRDEVARALFRHHHRPAVGGPRGRREVELPLRVTPAHPQRQGRGGVVVNRPGRHAAFAKGSPGVGGSGRVRAEPAEYISRLPERMRAHVLADIEAYRLYGAKAPISWK